MRLWRICHVNLNIITAVSDHGFDISFVRAEVAVFHKVAD